jgi:spore coat-associated protein N
MDTVATTPSVLTTDQFKGLQLAVSSCPVTWTESTANGVTTYSCSSSTSLADSPAVGTTKFTAGSLASVNPKSTDHLLLTLSLPTSADNSFQGKSSTLSITFTGSQRTGTNR